MKLSFTKYLQVVTSLSLLISSGLTPLLGNGIALAAGDDEIHFTVTGPTAVTFDWRGPDNQIRYGLSSSYGQTATAQTPAILPFSSPGPWQEAKISGLQTATTYHYSIGGGADHTFKTPPTASSSFTAVVEGDVGDSTSYGNMPVVQNQIAWVHPDLVLV